jgi:uncharacterized protein YqeY
MPKKTIKDQVQEEMKAAMRAQDKERLSIIRLILADFKRIEIDERIVLDEARELAVLDKMQKQRRDSIEQFKAANRNDLVLKEQYEFNVIQSFMPEALSEAEIQQLVSNAIKEASATTMQDMAKVMTILKPKLQGRADMGQVSAKIKALLGTAGS